MIERRIATSVLVIGSGAAGLRTAIELAERGVDALCLGKRRRDDAHTVLAAGGINAALATMDPDDSWQRHALDTLVESYWLADPRAVEVLCRRAPKAIEDLVRWGARFARAADGRLLQRFFGAHSHRRTCFAGDYTGREIQLALVRRAHELGVRFIDHLYVTRLLVRDGRAFNAYGFDGGGRPPRQPRGRRSRIRWLERRRRGRAGRLRRRAAAWVAHRLYPEGGDGARLMAGSCGNVVRRSAA